MPSAHRRTNQLAFAIASALAAGAAVAQTAPPAQAPSSNTLEEIVVTAERRSEKLMDVPMSIEAFGQEKLDQEGLRSVDDLTRVAPGVTFLRNGAGSSGNYNDEGSDISVRGIDSAAGAATTGIYIDDTPIQTRHLNFGTVTAYPALFDLDRVEVLKGPQGTLFGAGSEGGTIRFITPEASLNTFSGYARAEYGSIDGGGSNYEAGAAVGGPIIDGVLGFRISASFREDGGWVNRVNYTAPPSTTPTVGTPYGPGQVALYSGAPTVTGTTEKNANWKDTQTFRVALKWQPTDNLSVDPSFYAQTLHINDTAYYWLNISNPSSDSYNNGNAQRDPSTDPFWLAALKVKWSQPWADLTSNTSYFSRAQHSTSDYTQWFNSAFLYNQYPSNDVTSAFFTDHQNNFNQEFRLTSTDAQSKLQWSAGLFYTHTYEDSTEYVESPFGGAGFADNLVYLQPRFSMLDKQVAVFGEINWKFTDTLKLTLGARYSDLKFDGVVQEIEQGYFGSLNVNTPSSGESRPVTPRVVLNYQPDSDTLYYASASKGFRPGGINTQLPSNCFGGTNVNPATAAQPFSPDSLWQYEIGSKMTALDHRLTVSGSIYYLTWKNIQQFVYLACGLGFDYNLGEATGRGGDVEVNWKASEDLTLGMTAAYTSTYFNGPVALGPTDQLVAAGDHLPSSPWNLDFSGEYVWQAVSRKPYVRADYQYATPQNSLVPYQDAANAPNSDTTQPGLPTIRVLNLRAGLRFDGFDLSLFVSNALDYHSPQFVSRDVPTSGGSVAIPNNGWGANYDTNYFGRGFAPRTIGVTGTYKF
jgi:outer membrane receptor protein involved in Fe transport